MNAPISTEAKSMHLAMLIPDWNSLDSVRRTHNGFEVAALTFFGLLVLFDILSHLSKEDSRKTILEKIGLCFFAVAVSAEIGAYIYGHRNDTLSAAVITSLDSKASQAFVKASTAHDLAQKAEGEADTAASRVGVLQNGIAVARASLADIQGRIAWRSVSEDQKRELKYRLSNFRGQRLTVSWEAREPEENAFASQLVKALQSAGLNVTPQPVALLVGGPNDLDMYLTGSQTNPFLLALGNALVCSSIAHGPMIAGWWTRPSDPNLVLTIKPRNPTPKPPIPKICNSSAKTNP